MGSEPADAVEGPVAERREPSLWSALGRSRFLVGALLALSAVALGFGWSLPVVTLRRGLTHHTYSVLAGIVALGRDGNVLLALVLFAFSIVFPAVKLALLAATLVRRGERARSVRLLRWLTLLGRWSMLDVFVVVILVGSVQLGLLSSGEPRAGVLAFGAGILLSIVTSMTLELLASEGQPEPPPAARTPAARLRALAAAGLFAAGLALPVLHVEKWVFWDHDYSVLEATWHLAREGYGVLAATVGVFVVLLPALRFTALVWMRWGRPPARARSAARIVDLWAMLDVFGLALLVVTAQIGDLASVAPRPGFWLLLMAGLVSLADAGALHARATAR